MTKRYKKKATASSPQTSAQTLSVERKIVSEYGPQQLVMSDKLKELISKYAYKCNLKTENQQNRTLRKLLEFHIKEFTLKRYKLGARDLMLLTPKDSWDKLLELIDKIDVYGHFRKITQAASKVYSVNQIYGRCLVKKAILGHFNMFGELYNPKQSNSDIFSILAKSKNHALKALGEAETFLRDATGSNQESGPSDCQSSDTPSTPQPQEESPDLAKEISQSQTTDTPSTIPEDQLDPVAGKTPAGDISPPSQIVRSIAMSLQSDAAKIDVTLDKGTKSGLKPPTKRKLSEVGETDTTVRSKSSKTRSEKGPAQKTASSSTELDTGPELAKTASKSKLNGKKAQTPSSPRTASTSPQNKRRKKPQKSVEIHVAASPQCYGAVFASDLAYEYGLLETSLTGHVTGVQQAQRILYAAEAVLEKHAQKVRGSTVTILHACKDFAKLGDATVVSAGARFRTKHGLKQLSFKAVTSEENHIADLLAKGPIKKFVAYHAGVLAGRRQADER